MGDGVWRARRWVMGCGEPEGGCLGVESTKVGDGVGRPPKVGVWVWRARRWVMGCGEPEGG